MGSNRIEQGSNNLENWVKYPSDLEVGSVQLGSGVKSHWNLEVGLLKVGSMAKKLQIPAVCLIDPKINMSTPLGSSNSSIIGFKAVWALLVQVYTGTKTHS